MILRSVEIALLMEHRSSVFRFSWCASSASRASLPQSILSLPLAAEYSIDHKGLYATGQSGGGMMTMAMDIKYPELFSASLPVAGQWDPALVKPLAHKILWILVSQDDDKAWPDESPMIDVLSKEGATAARFWDGTWNAEQFHEPLRRSTQNGARSTSWPSDR
jgi:predicted peptidase